MLQAFNVDDMSGSDRFWVIFSLLMITLTNEFQDEAMQWAGVTSSSKHSRGKKSFGKIVKKTPKRRVKAKAQMVFPSEIARKKRQAQTKKT